MKVNFHMERLSLSIKDNKDKNEIIRLTVGELMSTLTQRPGAQAIKFVITYCFFGGVLCGFNSINTVCVKACSDQTLMTRWKPLENGAGKSCRYVNCPVWARQNSLIVSSWF